MNDLDYLITNSEDSILKEYSYASGELTILLYLTEIDQTINLKIKTDCLSFDNHYLEKEEELYRTCRIEIQELLNVLSVEHAVYLPSTTFPELMKDAKFNYSLAYGKRSTEIKYIFSLTGYGKLISCLLLDLNCIAIKPDNPLRPM